MTENLFIGVDVGTTAVKAAAYTAQGVKVSAARRPVDVVRKADGFSELPMEDVWDAVRACILPTWLAAATPARRGGKAGTAKRDREGRRAWLCPVCVRLSAATHRPRRVKLRNALALSWLRMSSWTAAIVCKRSHRTRRSGGRRDRAHTWTHT